MKKTKQAKLVEDKFWVNFFYFNLPSHINEVPEHVTRVNFRYYHANDKDILTMLTVVKSIDQLDLDHTDITIEGIKSLTKLHRLTEIRLKGCRHIGNDAMPFICQFKGLQLLHLIGTAVTTEGFENIGALKELKTLLISAEEGDHSLEKIYANLAPGCKMIVNYKAYPYADQP